MISRRLRASGICHDRWATVPGEIPQSIKVVSMNLNGGVGQVRLRAWCGIVLSALVLSAVALWAFTAIEARAASIQPLEIVTRTGVHVFSVEMATTEQEKE